MEATGYQHVDPGLPFGRRWGSGLFPGTNLCNNGAASIQEILDSLVYACVTYLPDHASSAVVVITGTKIRVPRNQIEPAVERDLNNYTIQFFRFLWRRRDVQLPQEVPRLKIVPGFQVLSIHNLSQDLDASLPVSAIKGALGCRE